MQTKEVNKQIWRVGSQIKSAIYTYRMGARKFIINQPKAGQFTIQFYKRENERELILLCKLILPFY